MIFLVLLKLDECQVKKQTAGVALTSLNKNFAYCALGKIKEFYLSRVHDEKGPQ
jgi:hypothetical protein